MEKEILLQFAIKNGMINMPAVQADYEEMEKKRLLQKHNRKKWQGKDSKWYTYLDNKLTKRKTETELDNAIIKYYREIEEEPTFGVMFERWSEKKLLNREIQKQTFDIYRLDFNSLIKDTVLENMKISQITSIFLEDYITQTIREKRLTQKRWSNLRVLLSGTIKYAKKHGYTDLSMRVFLDELELSPKMFVRKKVVDEEETYTKEEIKQIQDYVLSRSPSMAELGVLLGIETGMRRGEISALKHCDIQGDLLHVCRTEIRYRKPDGHGCEYAVRESTKGRDGERMVILTDQAKKILTKAVSMNPDGDFIFEREGERIKGHTFTNRIKEICKTLSIRPRTMHKVRKTYATNLLNAGVGEKLIEKQMGHTSITTTRQFYYYNNMSLEENKKVIQSALA